MTYKPQLHNDAQQSTDQQKGTTDQMDSTANQSIPLIRMFRKLFAELLGTFLLTVVGAGGIVINAIAHTDVDSPAHYISSGLIVMVLIYALGSTSGAHFNPAITLAFVLRRDFPWRYVPGYWIAQFLGALLAALALRALFGTPEHLGAPLPHHGVTEAFIIEVLLTFLLVTVVLGVASKGELVGNNVAIAVGGTIVLCGLFAGQISGASMNPARALGPYLVSGHLDNAWLYVVAPFVGALLAVAVAWLLRGRTNEKAVRAAQGE